MKRTGEAPGKVILFGEHAVVYGAAAVALPLSKHVKVTLRDGSGQVDVRLPRRATIPDAHRAAAPVELLRRALGAAFDALDVRVDLGVPPMAGFGSSAALAVATLRALGTPKSKPKLLARAIDVESVAHGRPSGIDPAASIWGAPIRFQRTDRIRVKPLRIGAPVYVVVATAGVHGGTAPVVARIGETRRAAPQLIGSAMDTLGAAADAGVKGLRTGDLELVGRAMKIAQGILDGFGLVGLEVRAAVQTAEAAGALGAKMSGAGGTGGALVAVCATPTAARRVVRALKDRGVDGWVESYAALPTERSAR